MKTLTIRKSEFNEPKPNYPDGYYFCQDRHGPYVAMRRCGAWSWMHRNHPNAIGNLATSINISSNLVEDDIVARLDFIP